MRIFVEEMDPVRFIYNFHLRILIEKQKMSVEDDLAKM